MRVCLHAHVVAVFWSQHFQTWLCLLHSASLRHQNLHMWVQSSARQSRSLLRSCWSTTEIWSSGWIYVHTHTPGLHSLPSPASSFLTSGNRIFPGFPRCRGLGQLARAPRVCLKWQTRKPPSPLNDLSTEELIGTVPVPVTPVSPVGWRGFARHAHSIL